MAFRYFIPLAPHAYQVDALRYLAQSPLLNEFGMPRILRYSIVVITAAVFLFIAWAAFTHIQEVAKAEGDVVPSGYVQVVQHLEGGMVRNILVKEGDIVEKGQIILELQSIGSKEDLAELGIRQMTLQLQAERLRAFIGGRQPDFSSFTDATSQQIEEQRRLFRDMTAAKNHEKEVIETQIAQKREQERSLIDKRNMLSGNIAMAQETHDALKGLMEQGLTSRMHYLEKKSALNSLKGERAEAVSDIISTEHAIKEGQERLASLDAQHRDDANRQLEQMESDIAQNNQIRQKLEERVSRLEVRAPVKGIVKGLAVNTVGGVVAAGAQLMEIVPLEDKLVVESKISTTDIGHIHVGQPVQVKVHSYDFSRYGMIEGTLESVSATTFIDEFKKSYYRGRVLLQHNYVGNDSSQNAIMPGMTVEADIITGEKTVLAYLLKPIYLAREKALKER